MSSADLYYGNTPQQSSGGYYVGANTETPWSVIPGGRNISRALAFAEGANKATQGAWGGTTIGLGSQTRAAQLANVPIKKGLEWAGRTLGRSAVAEGLEGAAVKTGIQTAGKAALASTAARVGAGEVAGAVAGRLAVGTGARMALGALGGPVGLAVGAALPFVLPHIPVVGDVVNKIPLIGGALSPKAKKKPQARYFYGGTGGNVNPSGLATAGGSNLATASPSNLAGPSGSMFANRPGYRAGRGYRR